MKYYLQMLSLIFLDYHAGIYLIVPLSSIGIHLVGFPATGAFNNVPAAAAAPFVKFVVVFIILPLLTLRAPLT